MDKPRIALFFCYSPLCFSEETERGGELCLEVVASNATHLHNKLHLLLLIEDHNVCILS